MSELTIKVQGGRGAPCLPARRGTLVPQTLHAARELVRTPMVPLVALALPLIFLLVNGLSAGIKPGGVGAVIHELAPSAAVFAVVMASFVMLAHAVSIAKEQGIIKRLRGTPLRAPAYLCGKALASATLALSGTAIMIVAACLLYGLDLPLSRVPAVALALLAGIACLSSLGLAAAMLLSSSQAVLGVTLGGFILVGFVSDLFFRGAQLPVMLEGLGWLLPLRHFVAAMTASLQPEAGLWRLLLIHVPALAAWALMGAVAGGLAFGREHRSAATRSSRRGGGGPFRFGSPSVAGMMWGQIRHANAGTWRAPIFAAFALAFPVVFVVLLPLATGNPVIDGASFARHMVVSMPVFAVALTAYVALADSLASARDRGLLKRLRGTPVPPHLYLAGRIGSLLWISAITVTIVLVAGRVVHEVVVPISALPALIFVLLVSTSTLAALGFAVAAASPDAGSVSAVTLATLLPLKFLSDVFPVGSALPPFVDAIGWVFPLKHMVHAMRAAIDGGELALLHLAVTGAWGLAAVALALLRFRWEPK